MREPLVRAVNVVRRYPGSGEVLLDATFEIGARETIAVTGPSGSGKTTLLHIIAGLDRPSSGEIAWPALAQPIRPGPVALAFQGPSLLAPLSVEENVALAAMLAGSSEADASARARELLLRFGVEDVADRLPEEISGGQSQRVGLARALVGRPALVVADEPTGQLDAETAASAIETLLEEVDRTDASLIVATHDVGVAERLAQRWTLHDGRLETQGLACSA
jgi:putative ABC transport system ATP-binding protein